MAKPLGQDCIDDILAPQSASATADTAPIGSDKWCVVQNIGEVYALFALEAPDIISITNDDKRSLQKDLGRPDNIFVVIDLLTGMVPWIQAAEMQPIPELKPHDLKADYREQAISKALFNACLERSQACAPYLPSLSPRMERNWRLNGMPASIAASDLQLFSSTVQSFAKAHDIKLLAMQDVPLTVAQEESIHVVLEQVLVEIQACLSTAITSTVPISDFSPSDNNADSPAWPDWDIEMHYSQFDQKVHMSLYSFQKMLIVAAYKTSVFMQKRCGHLPYYLLLSDLKEIKEIAESKEGVDFKKELLKSIKWSSHVSKKIASRPVRNYDLFYITLCPHFKIWVTVVGLNAYPLDLCYECAALNKNKFLDPEDHRTNTRAKAARIFIDPENINRAWLFPFWETEPTLFFECTLANWSEKYTDLSLVMAKAMRLNQMKLELRNKARACRDKSIVRTYHE